MPFPSILPQRARRGQIAVAAQIRAPRAIGAWKWRSPSAGLARLQIDQSSGLSHGADGRRMPPQVTRGFHPYILCLHPGRNPAITGAQRAVYRPLAGAQEAFASVALVLSSKMRCRHVPNRSKESRTISRLCRAVGPVLLPSPVVLPWKDYRCAPQEGEVA